MTFDERLSRCVKMAAMIIPSEETSIVFNSRPPEDNPPGVADRSRIWFCYVQGVIWGGDDEDQETRKTHLEQRGATCNEALKKMYRVLRKACLEEISHMRWALKGGPDGEGT